MNVSIGDTMPVILEDSDPRHHLPGIKKQKRDRRRDRQDRRKKNRDGVVVHLSENSKQPRSVTPERRKLTY